MQVSRSRDKLGKKQVSKDKQGNQTVNKTSLQFVLIRYLIVRLNQTSSRYTLENTEEQSRERVATMGTQDTTRRQTKQNTQHNMCQTPLCVNKHKQRKKKYMSPRTDNWR